MIEQRWEEQRQAKRRAIIEKKKAIAESNERFSDYWFYITPGEVLKTNVGIIKVAKKDKTSIITNYGKKYTLSQMFDSDIVKLIREKERMRNGANW